MIRRNKTRRLTAVHTMVLIPLAALPVLAQSTINYPNQTDTSIQRAITRAGCGGTVLLAAGTYSGAQLSTDPGPDYASGHILIPCGARLIGAGIDQTIIDGANSPSPNFGVPVIGIGFDPFNLHPFTENYELAHLSVTKPVSTSATSQAVAAGWAKGVHFHHLKIVGFDTAIRADITGNDEFDHITAQGMGPGVGRCIEFRELGFFFPSALPPNGHMTGYSIYDNDLSNCLVGINLANSDDASVHHNTIRNAGVGIQLRGVANSSVDHNLVANSVVRALNLVNVDNSSFNHNTYCQSPVAIRYGPSTTPSLFGVAPSGGISFDHESLLGNGQDFAFQDPNIGTGNTTSHITSLSGGVCPAP